jgi:hypothetical protein
MDHADHAEYCREVEAYLCRKNGGHLIRIVGPQFEQVRSWADRGIPITVAFRGIDRYCERHSAKGPRRRPVRIEFCEADILELFDDWRRAIGVSQEPQSRRPSLREHIDRAIARLLASGRGAHSPGLGERIDAVVRELDRLAGEARHARGDARARIVDRLAALDRDLLAAAVEETDAVRAEALRREADAELASFGSRMSDEARARAATAAFHRLVREALALPALEYE